jgi:hypothetical protein
MWTLSTVGTPLMAKFLDLLWDYLWKWHSCPVFDTRRASAKRSSRKKKLYPDGYRQKYELWTEREPLLNHFRVWGYPVEVKVFNPNTEKSDPKIVSCHFIGYPKKSKGYRFYCPDRHTKFIEKWHAAFLKDQMIRGSMVARKIDL